VAYEAAAARLLARLDTLYLRDRRLLDRLAYLRDTLRPQAEANLADARRLVQAGRMDALAYLELERGSRELRLAEQDLDLQRREIALDLEGLLGLPLATQPDIIEALPAWALTPSPEVEDESTP
jgi:outer membrane protein TolC